ncbi:MAG: tripartite tricarboxylate transporter substrate binding protein [Rhodospirillales bacterium]|nr:tripartite tricarboxylate transporter substrate binding protein [Rhodospirillales bacterium]
MNSNRRTVLAAALAAVLAAAFAGPAAAQTFPSKPIRFVVPFPPGGSLDVSARAVADKMTPLLGQPVVVENRPGAGGNVGVDLVAKSPADGHTIVMGALSTHAVNPHLYSKMPFDPLKDTVAITAVGEVPNILVVGPSVKAATVAELVAQIKANPKGFNYGSGGNGSGGHLAGALFADRIGVPVEHIPYQGGAPQLNALLSGETQFTFDNLANAYPQIEAGKLRPLAVTTPKRSAQVPNVPTMAEAGFPGFDISTWFGIFAPAGTPPDVVKKLADAAIAALKDPATVERLSKLAVVPVGNTPAQFDAFVRAEYAKYKDIVRISGAKVD